MGLQRVGHDLVTKEQQQYIYPLCFGLPSHLGHYRALGRIPCAAQ